ncbi:MAG: B12-binding domain-containing radical SAM protein [Thermodesulfobacteriota bacterium]
MLLVYPPIAKPCEPPAGIARLAGVLRSQGIAVTVYDANIEGLLALLAAPVTARDTWSRRAARHLSANLAALRAPALYGDAARYCRAVADVNRLLAVTGAPRLSLSLANYQDRQLSPLSSIDLLQAAARPEENAFYPAFAARLTRLVEHEQPSLVGISLNYLSQALSTFAILGFLRRRFPGLVTVLGGGLVTSWLSNPAWRNPFAGLVDHLVAGPGEQPLLSLLGTDDKPPQAAPDYQQLPLADYLAPGRILPYAASSGCYWNRCSFCPEKAEENPYHHLAPKRVLAEIDQLCQATRPTLIHLLDNAISPALLAALAASPPGLPWYGFARVSPQLADPDFCRSLAAAGCRMLKLGIESGDQGVLDAMDKGISLPLVSAALAALRRAGISTYVYLLFGTPPENEAAARRTLDFTVRHHEAITFLNLAIFNMPLASAEAADLMVSPFSANDLSLYTDFRHPLGWGRREVRRFLDREFSRHPTIAAILRRDPPLFTSNHAPFFPPTGSRA